MKPFRPRLNQAPILLTTLLAFALRIAFIESRELTIDEASSLKWIGDSSFLYLATHYHTNTHLLTTLLARLVDYGGHWLTFYRGAGAIFAVLTVPLLYQLSKRLLDRPAGLLAALLLAVAPFHVDFSIQMRGYTAMAFWAVVLYLCVWEGLKTGKLRYWVTMAVAGTLAVYAHLFGALTVGASWLVIGLTYLNDRRQHRPTPWFRYAVISLLLTGLWLAILYLPIFGRIINTPEEEQDWGTQVEPVVVDGQFNPAALADYLKVLRLFGPIGEPNSWFVLSFVMLAGIGLAALVGKFYAGDQTSPQVGIYLAIWIIAPMIVAGLGLQFIDGFYLFRRFFIFLQPLYLLLMAAGMLTVGRQAAHWTGHPVFGRGVITFFILVSLGPASWILYNQTSEDIDNHWYQVARIIREQSMNPLVICEPQGRRLEEQAAHRDECYRSLEFYLQSRPGEYVPWLQREIDQVATIPAARQMPQLEQQAGDVWLVLWQREWPSKWAGLQQTERLAGFNYYTAGSTLLIQAPRTEVRLLALTQIVDALIPVETTPEDRFSYYLSQAQMKAVAGDRATARKALLAARELAPEGIDAENRLLAVAQLIGMPLE